MLNTRAGEAENPELGEERMNEYIEKYRKDLADLETAGQKSGRALNSLDKSEKDKRGTLSAARSGKNDISSGREESAAQCEQDGRR